MPTYDYKCPKCCYVKEVFVSLLGCLDPTHCEECQMKMERQVSKPAVHFKGSGFYETDYKGK